MKLDVRHLGIPDRPLVGSLADDAQGRIFFLDETLDRVIGAVRRWPEFAAEAGLPDAHAAMLAREMPASQW